MVSCFTDEQQRRELPSVAAPACRLLSLFIYSKPPDVKKVHISNYQVYIEVGLAGQRVD